MISQESTRLKYINRGYEKTIVLIPGWATDYRIFDRLDLRFNYLVSIEFSPFAFERALLEALNENNIRRVSLFGWSLGGFIAAEFASKHPRLVDELILVSIRKQYKREALTAIRGYLKKNKAGYLNRFYTMCFREKSQMAPFKNNLFRDYCKSMNLDYLLKSLDYLESAGIDLVSLNGIKKIKILHGEYDSIAPINEAIEVKKSIPHARFTRIKGAGHMPFLKEGFDHFLW